MTTIAVSSGLLPLEAPLPTERTDDLLAVAEVIEGDGSRWLGGTWSEGWPPGPAFTHDPCSTGTNREKAAAGEIATQVSNGFVVYLPATCKAQFIGASIDRFRERLERAFKVYERAAVERVLVSGDGHDSLGGFLGDENMEALAADSVDPVTALRLLETAVAVHGGGIIHAAPSTVVAWDALNLTVVRGALTYTKRGTPVAVGAGYIGALPFGMPALEDDEQWAFASGPIEIIRGAIEVPGDTYAQVFERTSNDVEVIAERPYVFNWIGRQDPGDPDHTQAGVLVNESRGGGLPTVPSAPTLVAAVAGDGEVMLTWTAPASTGGAPLTGYRVYRSTSSGAETLLDTTEVTLGYTDTTAVNGTTYFYKVSAVNYMGKSALSNELSATPAGGELTIGGYLGNDNLAEFPIDGAEQYVGDILVIGGPWTPDVDGVLGIGYLRFDTNTIDGTGSRSQPLRLCLFLDNGSGTPTTTLVGVTDEVVVDETTPSSNWLPFPGWTNFGGPPSVDAGNTYWLGVWTGPDSGGKAFLSYNDDAAHGIVRGSGSVAYSSSANPSVSSWGSGGANRAYIVSFEVLV